MKLSRMSLRSSGLILLRGLNPRYLSPKQVQDQMKVFGVTLPKHGP